MQPAPDRERAAETPPALFVAVADAKRRRILEALVRGTQDVGDLSRRCRMSRPIVTHHLGIMQRAGLVRLHQGRASARPEGFEALRRYVDTALTSAAISAPER